MSNPWIALTEDVKAGKLPPGDVELLMRAGPAAPADREPVSPEVVALASAFQNGEPLLPDSRKALRRNFLRERRWWGELAGWVLFCNAGARFLSNTSHDGEEVEPSRDKAVEIAAYAIKRYEESGLALAMLEDPKP